MIHYTVIRNERSIHSCQGRRAFQEVQDLVDGDVDRMGVPKEDRVDVVCQHLWDADPESNLIATLGTYLIGVMASPRELSDFQGYLVVVDPALPRSRERLTARGYRVAVHSEGQWIVALRAYETLAAYQNAMEDLDWLMG